MLNPGSASVVNSGTPLTRNLNDCPPEAVKFSVLLVQTVIFVEAPPIFDVKPGAGFGDTVIFTDAVGAEHGTPKREPVTSLL